MTDLLGMAPLEEVTVAPKELAPLFKALAHPRRLAMLQLLRERELCVSEIEEALSLRQAYVSQQLSVLRETGLVCYRKDGWNVYYRLAGPEVYSLLEIATVIYSSLGSCALTDPEDAADLCCGDADED